MRKNIFRMKNEKGQTLLFVVVAVSIALAVGVSVSTRTLSSLRRVSRTDTSSRVVAVAEGGIENLLNQTYDSLGIALNPSTENCNSIGATYDGSINSCVYVFSGGVTTGEWVATDECEEYTCICSWCPNPDRGCSAPSPHEVWQCSSDMMCRHSFSCNSSRPSYCRQWEQTSCRKYRQVWEASTEITDSEDVIPSRAVVKVETFSTTEGSGYSFNLDPGSVREVFLSGYNSSGIRICWSNSKSAIYYSSYNQSGAVKNGGIKGPDVSSGDVEGFENPSGAGADGAPYCGSVSLISHTDGLRIRVLYESTRVVVIPSGGAAWAFDKGSNLTSVLPDQGYKLTSVGELSISTSEKETATVVVYKTYPYAPSIFDYGVYTPGVLK